MYKTSVFTTAQRTQENLPVADCSSAQIVKQPRKKKHTPRPPIKTRHSQRRPPQQKVGPGRSCSSQGLNTGKSPHRIAPQSQECRLKICYGNQEGSLAKLPPESKVGIVSPKMASKQSLGHSNSSRAKAKERTVSGKGVSKTEHPQPLPPPEKPGKLNNTIDNQSSDRRVKPTAMEKRPYQTISEYQFIYPGKAVFHCTRETMKQRLRSIYLTNQKRLKQRTSHAQGDVNKAQRANPSADAKHPVDGGLLGTAPPGLPGLTYKINKLVLVSEKTRAPPENPPCTLAGNWHAAPPEHPLSPKRSAPQVNASQRSGAFPERKVRQEGHGAAEQRCDPDLYLQGITLNLPHVCSPKTPRPRAMSAKDCYEKPPPPMFGEEDPNGASPGREDGVRSSPRKTAVTHSRSAIVIPTASRFLSNESVSAELAGSNNAPSSVAEAGQPVPHYVAFGQAVVRDARRAGILAAHPILVGRKDKATPS
ncbi:uncharacterized protein LOC128338816 [Hemicordylus capensis]|uniref:uncharacterized protein LOC128338816 n=1 Tax=Hemicordylus capensis TaxID=884348 RepID=UPI00230218FA|nr:uncharacterized protein LOC128338816 [Hemicordylus capensis]